MDRFTALIQTHGSPHHGTYPAGLLRIHPDVPAPHGPPIVGVSGDVGEGGDGGARVGDRSAVQETAQRGAQRRKHLVKVTLFTSFNHQ